MEPQPPPPEAPIAIASRLVAAFHNLDASILASSAASGSRDGSTALIAMRCGQHIYTAHVGDTRAVAVIAPAHHDGRRAHAVRLTRDHTASCGIEAARVRAAGGRLHHAGCWRVIADEAIDVGPAGGPSLRAALAVTRALGDGAFKRGRTMTHSASATSLASLAHAPRGVAQQTVLATPDVARLQLRRDVMCVVCATDGLGDAVSDDEAAAVAHAVLVGCDGSETAEQKAQRVADTLVTTALKVCHSCGHGGNPSMMDIDALPCSHSLSLRVQRGSLDNVTTAILLPDWEAC